MKSVLNTIQIEMKIITRYCDVTEVLGYFKLQLLRYDQTEDEATLNDVVEDMCEYLKKIDIEVQMILNLIDW